MKLISIETVEQSILELEQKDTSFTTCERLAWLYIVRDHLAGYSIAPEPKTQAEAKSDFLQAVQGKDQEKAWTIIDKLMQELRIMFPETYNGILQELNEI